MANNNNALQRSLSSRRRRASRSAASSPNRLGAQSLPNAPSRSPRGSVSAASDISALGNIPGGGMARRASISVGEGISKELTVPSFIKTNPRGSHADTTGVSPRSSRLSLTPDMDGGPDYNINRGHRKSIAPELLSSDDNGPRSSRSNLGLEHSSRSPRNSLTPDMPSEYGGSRRPSVDPGRSPRGSLIPGDYNRSPRNSLVPDVYNRSPRNSLCPDAPTPSRSPRHSLVPDGEGFNRSPRPSIVHDSGDYSRPSEYSRSPRPSLIPADADFSRSPRPSLIPSDVEFNRSARPSLVPGDPEYNRSPRSSLVPDSGEYNRRPSLIPSDTEFSRSPRASLIPEAETPFTRGRSDTALDLNRSPRGSVGGEPSRSPRGSYVQEMGPVTRSPRGSLGHVEGGVSPFNRSPRGSLGAELSRSPRNSLSPRGSLTGATGRASVDLSVAGPSRTGSQRSTSPYKGGGSGVGASGAGDRGTRSAYGTSPGNSRRASSNPSQVSGDDRRQLCAESTKLSAESSNIAAYGSLQYQLKDANLEASSSCDFVVRAMKIVYKTTVVTVIMGCLTAMPIIMLCMGVKFLRECPEEPNLPMYMVVGGVLGSVRMSWFLWEQAVSRRYARLSPGLGQAALEDNSTSIGLRMASAALSLFLLGWVGLGTYWTARIMWPEFRSSLYNPNGWCDKTLYLFSIVHLGIVYGIFGVIVIVALSLWCYQLLLCPLVLRYK